MSPTEALVVRKKAVAKLLAKKRGSAKAVQAKRILVKEILAGRSAKKRVWHVEQSGAHVIRITDQV